MPDFFTDHGAFSLSLCLCRVLLCNSLGYPDFNVLLLSPAVTVLHNADWIMPVTWGLPQVA